MRTLWPRLMTILTLARIVFIPMRKSVFCALACLCAVRAFSAELTALKALEEAAKKESVYDSAEFLEKTAIATSNKTQKRAMYVYLANLKEQMGLYSEASAAYATAAGISAPDADGSGRNTPEKLVLDAVRAELSAGNYENAEQFLRSAVKNSSDKDIAARVKLYTQWCALCRAESIEQTRGTIATLEAYAKQADMKSVRPAVLLTLWHLTENASYAQILKKEYPTSPEAAVVSGKSHLAPAPFWYFVPRKGSSGTTVAGGGSSAADKAIVNKPVAVSEKTAAQKESGAKLQLGLFRRRENADELCAAVKKKGFSANVKEEVRSSGTTYYLVYVSENGDTSMSKKLKAAGFDNYPLD